MAKTERGYFLIADITGYTVYLNTSELEHAHEVLQTLLELLIKHTRPPLVISRLAGDAVISYGLGDSFLQGQTFLEMIEDTYVAFRQAIDLMVLNNKCQCNACTNIGSLDLKFFIHYGAFTRQRLDRHDELLGPDVNILHRLLKNQVARRTGIRAYAMFTEAAVRQMGIEDISAAMVEHTETYDDVGEIRAWVQDMEPIWRAKKEAMRIEIPEGKTMFTVEEHFPLPVERVWDVLVSPEYRTIFTQATRQEVQDRKHGRVGPGSVYQCFHGEGAVTNQTVVEWIPFQSLTTEDATPVPKVTVLANFNLEPEEGGTHLVFTMSKGRGPLLNRIVCDIVARILIPSGIRKGMAALNSRLQEEIERGDYAFDEPEAFEPVDVAASIREELARMKEQSEK